jgi:two-component system NtrC family response regulator
MVEDKSFRDDLYYRLKGIQVRTTALAERAEDVALIVQALAARMAPAKRLAPAALEWVVSRSWPGNVRELQHSLQTAAALAGMEPWISVDDLALACGEAPVASAAALDGSLDAQVAALEKRLIVAALDETGHNHTHAAKQLGISRVGLLNKMRRYSLR